MQRVAISMTSLTFCADSCSVRLSEWNEHLHSWADCRSTTAVLPTALMRMLVIHAHAQHQRGHPQSDRESNRVTAAADMDCLAGCHPPCEVDDLPRHPVGHLPHPPPPLLPAPLLPVPPAGPGVGEGEAGVGAAAADRLADPGSGP